MRRQVICSFGVPAHLSALKTIPSTDATLYPLIAGITLNALEILRFAQDDNSVGLSHPLILDHLTIL